MKKMKRYGYRLRKSILDAQYYGCPQRRRRLIIVALHKQVRGKFQWPRAGPTAMSSMWFLDPVGPGDCAHKNLPENPRQRCLVKRAVRACLAQGVDPKTVVVDIGCSMKYATMARCGFPCLTRTRCSSFSYWIVARGRAVRLTELCRGFGLVEPHGFLELVPDTVSESAVARMLGNSLGFGVCRAVIKAGLKAIMAK